MNPAIRRPRRFINRRINKMFAEMFTPTTILILVGYVMGAISMGLGILIARQR